MPNQKNISAVASLQEKLNKAKSVVLANFKGLKVIQLQDLKKQVKQAQGEFTVAKNTLFKIALKNLKFELPPDFDIKEETGVLFSYFDEVSPLKKLVAFAKALNLPTLKFGFLGKAYMPEAQVSELSKIPPREVLLGQLVGNLNSPALCMVWALKGNLTKLVTALNDYKSKKSVVGSQ